MVKKVDVCTGKPREAKATQLEILDAAESLYAAHGHGSTLLEQIAKNSNIYKSLIMNGGVKTLMLRFLVA
jgi:cellobiose-specific phosphotransferase system component IIA